MPIYEYGCAECEHTFTEWASVYDRKIPCLEPCSECGGDVSIFIGVPSIKFVGDGWTPKYHK